MKDWNTPYRPLTNIERKRVKRLRRRCDFLRARIAERPEGELSWDEAELSALVWVTDAVESLISGTYQAPVAESEAEARAE